jgi:hypothetical protein
MNPIPNIPKNPNLYICKNCHYKTYNKKDYKKHLSTQKHKNLTNPNNTYLANPIKIHNCLCGKKYKHSSTLSAHKKKCVVDDEDKNTILDNNLTQNSSEVVHLTTLVMKLMNTNEELQKKQNEFQQQTLDMQKQNQDFQSKILDVYKNSNITHNNSNNNNSHSHNKTFNLQVFLNEDCKDAMNLSEFVNSLQLQLSDLDNMGKLGYTEGISKIIMTEMNDLEQTKRPVHCSDIKREILYVKDEDKWEKEQPNHPKLNKAIRKIEQKNFGLMGEWQAEHPTYMESTSEENNEFLKLISQTVNGTPDNINKVIKKIAKEVIINK